MAKIIFTCILVSMLVISSKALPTQVNAAPANSVPNSVPGQTKIAPAAVNLVTVAGQVTKAAVVNPVPVAGQVTNAPAVSPLLVAGLVTKAAVVNPAPVAGQVTNAPAVNPVPVVGQVTNAPAVSPLPVAGQVTKAAVVNPVPVVGQVTNAPAVSPLSVAGQVTKAAVLNPVPVAGQVTKAAVVNPVPVVGQVTNAPAMSLVPVAGQVTKAAVVNPVPVAGQVTNASTSNSGIEPRQTVKLAAMISAAPSLVVKSSTAATLKQSSLGLGPASFGENIPAIDNETMKIVNIILNAINNLIAQSKSFSLAISDGTCNSEQSMLGSLINRSFRKMLLKLITSQQKQLADIQISELPTYSDSFSSFSNVSAFQMKNIVIKGLESITVSKLEFDLCAMSFESEVTVPNLVLSADYILKGVVDSSPIEGAGKLSVTVDSLYIYDQSFLDCNTIMFAEDVCKFSSKNKTVDINMKSVTVNISGVKYKNLTDAKINEGINYFIGDYVKSNKLGLVQKISDLMVRFKSQTMNGHSPVSLLKKLKADLQRVPTQLKSKLRTLQRDNIFQNFFTLYV